MRVWLITSIGLAECILSSSTLAAQPPSDHFAGSSRREASAVVYVDADNVRGPGNGSGWDTAFRTVGEGIDAASAAGGGEVWVAEGTYKPTTSTDRSVSFQLKPGVAVFGGFKGTETRRSDRDWRRHVTILSGDIGTEGHDGDNSYHVVLGADRAVLDGFTITGGNGLDVVPTSGPRGGPRLGPRSNRGPTRPPGGPRLALGATGASPVPRRNHGQDARGTRPIHTSPQAILSGIQPGAGGGMVNFQCAPTIRNCLFKANQARKGGAMYNMVSQSFPPNPNTAPGATGVSPVPRRNHGQDARATRPAPIISNCTFLENYAMGRGGAVSNDLGTSPTFTNCRFINNRTDEKGGAMYNDFACSPIVTQCLFVGNRAFRAGAIGNDGGSSPVIACSTFTRNEAADAGAALYQGTGPANNPVVTRCILWANVCPDGPAEIANWHDCQPIVTHSCIEGGYVGQGNIDADPRFVDPLRGDYRLAADSPCPDAGYTAEVPEPDPLRGCPAGRQPVRRLQPDGREREERPTVGVSGQVVYVNGANQQSRKDGASWATAYTSLQQGIDHAWRSGGGTAPSGEVWVARGTYKPTTNHDRTVSFRLRPGVALYGGFSGSERSRDQRDFNSNQTVLSGDIGKPGDLDDNAYHVLIGADRAVLDGLTITGGNADGQTYDAKGGGVINYRRSPQGPPRGSPVGYSPRVRNCLFIRNSAIEGGAMYNYDRGTIELADCRFVENAAEYGGAIVDRVGVVSTVTRCTFVGNRAKWRGGAIYLDYGSRATITDCSFQENRSDCHGGAIYMVSRASQLENTAPTIRNSTFIGNTAGKRGGAIANSDKCLLLLWRCTLSRNHAGTGGGALAGDHQTHATVSGCLFRNNTADRGKADVDTDPTSYVEVEP